jgi:hypothetical protein
VHGDRFPQTRFGAQQPGFVEAREGQQPVEAVPAGQRCIVVDQLSRPPYRKRGVEVGHGEEGTAAGAC